MPTIVGYNVSIEKVESMLLSFKTELKPNNKQVTQFRQHCGVARHAYNWGNAVIIEVLKLRESDKSVKVPSAIDLHKKLVAEVKPANPWYYESSKWSSHQALIDVRSAWDKCFKKITKQPRFKKKGKSRDSFHLERGTKIKPTIVNDGKRIQLPKIGWVRLAEPLPVKATHSCVISRNADKWFISIKCEIEKPVVADNRPSIGVDIGIKELAVTSDGKVFANPKAYRRMSKRLKRLNRNVSRKVKGSKNRAKAVTSLARLHARVANIRKDAIHKLTTHLAKNHSVVKIEDLNIKAFLKNHKLAGAIADCGMFEFRRQLTYKTKKFSSELVLVDRMFPSSQICSSCQNHRHKMPLKNRVYECPDCSHKEDRDLNAAKNIERWFEGIYIPIRSDQSANFAEIACGVGKPSDRQIRATLKQEVSSASLQLTLF